MSHKFTMKSKYKHFLRGLGLGLVLMTSGFVQAATPNPPAGRAPTTTEDLSGKIYIDRSLIGDSDKASASEQNFYPYDLIFDFFSGTDTKVYPLYILKIDIVAPSALTSFQIDFFHYDHEKKSSFLFTNEADPNQSKLVAAQEKCLIEHAGQTEQCEIQEATQKEKCTNGDLSKYDACISAAATQAAECKDLKELKKSCIQTLEGINGKKFYKPHNTHTLLF